MTRTTTDHQRQRGLRALPHDQEQDGPDEEFSPLSWRKSYAGGVKGRTYAPADERVAAGPPRS